MSAREQIIWAAGIFEGEGSWGLYHYNHGGKPERKVQAYIASTDLDVIERFAKAVGMPASRHIRHPKGQHKDQYVWAICGYERVQALGAMFWPWLGTRRREKWEEITRAYSVDRRGPRAFCRPAGHPMTPDNVLIEANGKRRCLVCRRASSRRASRARYERHKLAQRVGDGG